MPSKQTKLKVAIVGNGPLGTALAHLAATAGHHSTLLTSSEQVMESINSDHRHPVFFKGSTLHPKMRATTDLHTLIPSADLIVMATTTEEMRTEAKRISALTTAMQSVLSVTKGFEPDSHKLMSQVLLEELPTSHIGTLSGPNITLDLVKGLPTALILASASAHMREQGQKAFSSPSIHIITSENSWSYEYTSALKNIVALEVGVVSGLRLGDNFRALVFAKGMAEIGQLLKKMGLAQETFYGLAGLSDIFLTCSSYSAQNYAIGLQRGTGVSLANLQNSLNLKGEGAEGLESLKVGVALARQYRCPAPLLVATEAFIFSEEAANKDIFISAAFK